MYQHFPNHLEQRPNLSLVSPFRSYSNDICLGHQAGRLIGQELGNSKLMHGMAALGWLLDNKLLKPGKDPTHTSQEGLLTGSLPCWTPVGTNHCLNSCCSPHTESRK